MENNTFAVISLLNILIRR